MLWGLFPPFRWFEKFRLLLEICSELIVCPLEGIHLCSQDRLSFVLATSVAIMDVLKCDFLCFCGCNE